MKSITFESYKVSRRESSFEAYTVTISYQRVFEVLFAIWQVQLDIIGGQQFKEICLRNQKGENMETKPALEASLVQEFVGNSHGDLNRVKELLAQCPSLINACWDLGGGDFETGLGAAAHMGRRDIAEYLLDNGARLDLFAAAMLGKLEIVKAALTTFPDAINTPGPHGIPLIAHDKAGEEDAKQVLAYLESLL